MKKSLALGALLAGVCFLGTLALPLLLSQSQTPAPQACSDDEAVVTSVKQDLSALVDTIKKENQDDFDTKYHQQTCLSRLSICLSTTSELLDCLDKATKDTTTPKEQMGAIKAKQAEYTKLKNALDQDIQSLKSAKDSKEAKSLIGNFGFGH